jgi:hypothetical protein
MPHGEVRGVPLVCYGSKRAARKRKTGTASSRPRPALRRDYAAPLAQRGPSVGEWFTNSQVHAWAWARSETQAQERKGERTRVGVRHATAEGRELVGAAGVAIAGEAPR